MRLEDVTAEIRPRAPWESIDLGCALARRHLGTVLKAWGLTVVPLWIVLALLLRNHPILFIFCVWWLKPIYDRVPLLVLSRALFGAVPSMGEVVRAWPKVMIRRLWFSLIIARFSPARSLSLPVSELEGLRGKAYRQRVDLLERNGGEGATKATLAGVLLELVTGLGMVMLVMMMVPDQVSSRWSSGIGDYFTYHDATDIPAGFFWLMSLVYMASIALMEPFYVAAGFALYINSRTLTEGWDIELAFKRMSARLSQPVEKVGRVFLVGWLVISSMMVGAPTARADAQKSVAQVKVVETSEAQDVSKERIQEVVSDDDFTIHHRYVDVPVKKEKEDSWWDDLFSDWHVPDFIGVLAKALFYGVVGAFVVWVVYLIVKNRWVFTSFRGGEKSPKLPKTTEVMGMDVSPESLPDDVAEAARNAWRDGDVKLAMSLLYRGSIASLIHKEDVPIEESDTEGDCVARVREVSDPGRATYFAELTQEWIAVAYGEQVPADQVVAELCDRWPFDQVVSKQEGRAL